MKIKRTTWAFLLGVALILVPVFLDFPPSWLWYFCALVGGVFTCIAGYDARAQMLGLGNPGEDLLIEMMDKIKKLKWW